MTRFEDPDSKPHLTNSVGASIDIAGEMRNIPPLKGDDMPPAPDVIGDPPPVQPVERNPHDMQIDPDTGLPVAIAPEGSKQDLGFDNDNALDDDTPSDTGESLPDEGKFRIDPESRIPRPVQPDLA